MTLKDYVQNLTLADEKLIVISPWSVMRLMLDGSAILYKNPLGTIQEIGLSRNDIEFIKGMALPVRIFTPGPESEKDVHTEHCCVVHGCKYGYDTYDFNGASCSVTKKRKSQSFACESCYADAGLTQEEHPYCGWRDSHE